MEPDVRAGIAYIAVRLISGLDAPFIYDHFQGKRHYFGGLVAADRVHVYDYDHVCYFGGLFNGVQYCLWHYRHRHQVDLKIEGDQFVGYDHSKNRHFHGRVTGADVQLCDYGTSSYFRYSI